MISECTRRVREHRTRVIVDSLMLVEVMQIVVVVTGGGGGGDDDDVSGGAGAGSAGCVGGRVILMT